MSAPTQELVGSFDDDEFELDLAFIAFPSPMGDAPCETDDGCGSTCENSACVTSAAEPF